MFVGGLDKPVQDRRDRQQYKGREGMAIKAVVAKTAATIHSAGLRPKGQKLIYKLPARAIHDTTKILVEKIKHLPVMPKAGS